MSLGGSKPGGREGEGAKRTLNSLVSVSLFRTALTFPNWANHDSSSCWSVGLSAGNPFCDRSPETRNHRVSQRQEEEKRRREGEGKNAQRRPTDRTRPSGA